MRITRNVLKGKDNIGTFSTLFSKIPACHRHLAGSRLKAVTREWNYKEETPLRLPLSGEKLLRSPPCIYRDMDTLEYTLESSQSPPQKDTCLSILSARAESTFPGCFHGLFEVRDLLWVPAKTNKATAISIPPETRSMCHLHFFSSLFFSFQTLIQKTCTI